LWRILTECPLPISRCYPLRRREMILIRVDHELTVRLRSGALKRMSRGARGDAGKEQTGNRTAFALLAGWKLKKSFTQRRGGSDSHPPRSDLRSQEPDLDVTQPDTVSMILEADVAAANARIVGQVSELAGFNEFLPLCAAVLVFGDLAAI